MKTWIMIYYKAQNEGIFQEDCLLPGLSVTNETIKSVLMDMLKYAWSISIRLQTLQGQISKKHKKPTIKMLKKTCQETAHGTPSPLFHLHPTWQLLGSMLDCVVLQPAGRPHWFWRIGGTMVWCTSLFCKFHPGIPSHHHISAGVLSAMPSGAQTATALCQEPGRRQSLQVCRPAAVLSQGHGLHYAASAWRSTRVHGHPVDWGKNGGWSGLALFCHGNWLSLSTGDGPQLHWHLLHPPPQHVYILNQILVDRCNKVCRLKNTKIYIHLSITIRWQQNKQILWNLLVLKTFAEKKDKKPESDVEYRNTLSCANQYAVPNSKNNGKCPHLPKMEACPSIHIYFRLSCCLCPILWGWQHRSSSKIISVGQMDWL